MSDLIERDALLQDMTHRGGLGIGDWHVFDVINEQPAVNRWIACSERLPEDGELVLIAHVSGSVYIADREGKYWAEDSGEWYDDEKVTHWMPMPEPPEKE